DHLQGIKLIIKTLGAGFHQPVEGIHCLSMNEQKKLMMQNLWLAEFARHYNIDVIDTFNITVARYKDFLQGKCACQLSQELERRVTAGAGLQVVPVQAPKNRPPGKPPPPPSYHVEGDINAVYSEILLNRICAKYARTADKAPGRVKNVVFVLTGSLDAVASRELKKRRGCVDYHFDTCRTPSPTLSPSLQSSSVITHLLPKCSRQRHTSRTKRGFCNVRRELR
ncbi:hypothetical protein MRX96_049165, partial [Rhipicephalus microplus]